MFEKPQAEHEWLKQLTGSWIAETECQMGPGEPTYNSVGDVNCRSLGGMWFLLEGGGGDEESGSWSTLMTLGYDIKLGQYVGTCTGSMMSCLWSYQGGLDATGRKLTLDTVGPKCGSEGTTSYKDAIEVIDESRWILTSEMLTEEGEWLQIMTSEHRRKN